MNRTLALMLLVGLAWPCTAEAGGGGTRDPGAEYAYPHDLYLQWITADGQCGSGEFCFRLVDGAHREPWLAGTLAPDVVALAGKNGSLPSRTLAQVSAPTEQALVLAQEDSGGHRWFIYDGAAERFLLDGATREAALARWSELGLPAPHLEVATEGVRDLPPTVRSQLQEHVVAILFGAFVVSLASVVLVMQRVLRRAPGNQ